MYPGDAWLFQGAFESGRRRRIIALMAKDKLFNPFYTLLVPVGAAFVVTAFAYGFMAFQAVNPAPVDASSPYAVGGIHPLLDWLRARGDAAMLIELAVLAALTVLAIAYDSWFDRSGQTESSHPEKNDAGPTSV